MVLIYISTILFAFTISLVPALQYLLDPVFAVFGVGAGFKTPLVDMAILICMAMLFIHLPTGHRKEIFKTIKWWLLWLIYLLLRSSFGGVGLWKLEMYIAKVFIPTIAIALVYIASPQNFDKYFFGSLIVAAIVLIPATYLYDFNDKDFFSNIWLSRAVGICVLYLFITMKNGISIILKASMCVIFIVSMIAIGSRGPVISVLLSMSVYFILKYRSNAKVLFSGILVSVIAGVIVIQLASISIESSVASFLSHGQADVIQQIEKADDRTGVYAPTYNIFLDSPVTGVGLGRWAQKYYHFSTSYGVDNYLYPHNIVLEIGSELGIIGLIIFALLFVPYKRIFNLNNPYNIFILLGFLYASTSSDLTQNSLPMIFGILSLLNSRRMQLRKTVGVVSGR